MIGVLCNFPAALQTVNLVLACGVQIEASGGNGAAPASVPGLEAEAFESVSFVGCAA